MKTFISTFIILLIASCVYDPPQKPLVIRNASDSAIYVYCSCSEKIEFLPVINLFDTIKKNGIDEIASPQNRVNAYSYSELQVGNRENLIKSCPNNIINIFFIKEITLRTFSWKQIVNKQIFERKLAFNSKKLDSLNWVVTYEP